MNKKVIKVFLIKFKYPLFKFLFFVFGVFFISFLYCLKFIPKIANDLWHTLTTQRFGAIGLTIVLLLITLYNTLKLLGEIKQGKSLPNIRLVQYLIFLLRNFYDFCWLTLNYIAKKVFKYNYLQYKVIRILVKSFNNPKHFPYYFFVLMCLKFLPRVIFVVVFFWEACFQHYLEITFICIPFLLIVYLEAVFVFLINDFYKSYFKELSEYVKEIQILDKVYYYYKPEFENQYPADSKNGADFLKNHFEIARQIPETLRKYQNRKNYKNISKFIQLILYNTCFLTYLYMFKFVILFV